MSGLLLTGSPGVGKTTVMKRVADLLADAGYRVSGFFTDEVLANGERVGFDLVPWARPELRAAFARVGMDSPIRISRYGVDSDIVQTVGIPAIEAEGDVVLVDEIGGMELSCPAFTDVVTRLRDGQRPWLATVQIHPHSYTDQLKRDLRSTVITVSADNRDALPADIVTRLRPG